MHMLHCRDEDRAMHCVNLPFCADTMLFRFFTPIQPKPLTLQSSLSLP
jgi:hypothetical protein